MKRVVVRRWHCRVDLGQGEDSPLQRYLGPAIEADLRYVGENGQVLVAISGRDDAANSHGWVTSQYRPWGRDPRVIAICLDRWENGLEPITQTFERFSRELEDLQLFFISCEIHPSVQQIEELVKHLDTDTIVVGAMVEHNAIDLSATGDRTFSWGFRGNRFCGPRNTFAVWNARWLKLGLPRAFFKLHSAPMPGMEEVVQVALAAMMQTCAGAEVSDRKAKVVKLGGEVICRNVKYWDPARIDEHGSKDGTNGKRPTEPLMFDDMLENLGRKAFVPKVTYIGC